MATLFVPDHSGDDIGMYRERAAATTKQKENEESAKNGGMDACISRSIGYLGIASIAIGNLNTL